MLQTIEINPEISPRASVIWLHGLGASGYDFVDIVESLNLSSSLGVRFVFPHAPIMPVKYASNTKMRAWFDVVSLERDAQEDGVGIKRSEQLINQLIVKELESNIPSDKIVIAGFSQGGVMALQCGLRYPEKLAGILVLSAWLPLANSVIAERAPVNIETPVLMLHGTDDSLIPLDWAAQSYDYLKEIGHSVSMVSYPMQHNVCPEEINAIGVWLSKVLS